ncbi:hypothetical protein GLOIN_2v1775583 [Rhizophagus irregularis DAOM 181602=DAOM 197198]|nr:hypothetical protein GLOIN_2v1775583 [Rhizophagus irregularis DAOM 181602=DAOM 197198]
MRQQSNTYEKWKQKKGVTPVENFDIAMDQCIGKVSSNIEEFEENGTGEFESSSIKEFEGSNTKESKGISNKLKY